MAEQRAQRRLAAILAADVVGYSRLMRADEAGTLEQLKSLRKELIDPKIAEYGGRIVKTTGDGILIEFPSAVDAVQHAIDVQTLMQPRIADLPPDRRMEIRIGINVGDVVVEGEDLFGDGVNVAARLEGLADPGGICISGNAYEQVRDKLQAKFEDLGEKPVKNIDRPVQAYRVSLDTREPAKAIDVQSDTAPLPLPDKPSIAVLPFSNMSGDPEQEYFSDGITEDIITALSHIRQFFVIARNTTFTFKGQAVDVQAVAKDLGVRYVLEGSVRKAGNRARITAQLIDGETGNHVWAERYDRDLEDIFAVQDEITQIVVGTLGPELSRAEQERARLKPPDNLDAWNLYHRGLWHMWRYEKDDIAEARGLFRRAIEFDPRHSPAFVGLAYTHVQEMYLGLTDDPAKALDQAMRFTGQALNLDDRDSFTYVIRAITNVFRRDHPAARNDARTALDINPSNAMAHMVLGISYHWCNEPGPSSHCFDEAERLSPRDPVIWLSLLGRTLGYLIEEKFEEANAVGKRAIAISNVPLVVRFVHASALGHLGRAEEAQTAINTMLRINPGFSLKYVERVLPTNEQHVRDIVLNGLVKAGAPVG
jgi:adenylate cyclase